MEIEKDLHNKQIRKHLEGTEILKNADKCDGETDRRNTKLETKQTEEKILIVTTTG